MSIFQYPSTPSVQSVTVTITSGQSLSPSVDLRRFGEVLAILAPAAWTAATLTFQGSVDNVNFFNISDANGTAYNPAFAAGVLQTMQSTVSGKTSSLAVPYLKVRSGTSGAPVTQAADRILTLICRT